MKVSHFDVFQWRMMYESLEVLSHFIGADFKYYPLWLCSKGYGGSRKSVGGVRSGSLLHYFFGFIQSAHCCNLHVVKRPDLMFRSSGMASLPAACFWKCRAVTVFSTLKYETSWQRIFSICISSTILVRDLTAKGNKKCFAGFALLQVKAWIRSWAE